MLLSVLAEQRLLAGKDADLASLLGELAEPPIAQIGALDVDSFMSKNDRRALAAALNTRFASPTFASWRRGSTLDVAEWMKPVAQSVGANEPKKAGKTPAVIVGD